MDEAMKTLMCRELRHAVSDGDGVYEDLIYKCLDVDDSAQETERAYGRMAVAALELASELWDVQTRMVLVKMRAYVASPSTQRRQRAEAAVVLTINVDRVDPMVAVVLTVIGHLIHRDRAVAQRALIDLWPVIERATPNADSLMSQAVSESLVNSSLLAAYGGRLEDIMPTSRPRLAG